MSKKHTAFDFPGLDEDDIKTYASGASITPFTWIYDGNQFKMKLVSGFAGATMSEDGYIMP